MKPSRPMETMAPPTSTVVDTNASHSVLLDKIAHLESKYRVLLQTSQSELERNFDIYRRAAETRNQGMDVFYFY